LDKSLEAYFMELTQVPIANPVVVLREEFDDWAVLFNPDTAAAVGINPIGVAIWKLLDGQRNVQAIADEIRQQFTDVPENAPAEIGEYLESLLTGGFIGLEVKQTS
jgi:SynChlorMet cassette protein ScmD